MCQQESSAYKCEDYLHCRGQSPVSILDQVFFRSTPPTMTPEGVQACINNRSKMVSWCMSLMDACQLNRETVSIAMSYLDRFLATAIGEDCIEDSATFQLACMTALYSAIKIHEEKVISPEVLSTISRGFYTKTDMEAMEWKMLNAISWRVNVPTPQAFCRQYLSLLPAVDAATREQLLQLCSVQTELSVADYEFVTVKPSSIGFAALVNAMDVLGLDVTVTNAVVALGMVDAHQVFRIQSTLYAGVANLTHLRTQARRPIEPPAPLAAPKRRQSHTISPRAVCEQ